MVCCKFQPKLHICQKYAVVANQNIYWKYSKKQDKLEVSHSEVSDHQAVNKLLGQNVQNVLDSDSDSEDNNEDI